MYFVHPVANKDQVAEMENSQIARRAKEINCKMPLCQNLIVCGRKYTQHSGIPTLIQFRL